MTPATGLGTLATHFAARAADTRNRLIERFESQAAALQHEIKRMRAHPETLPEDPLYGDLRADIGICREAMAAARTATGMVDFIKGTVDLPYFPSATPTKKG